MNTLLEKIGVSPIEVLGELTEALEEPGYISELGDRFLDQDQLKYLIDLVEQDISGEVVVI